MFCVLAFGLPIGFCPDETISGYADRSATYRLEELGGTAVTGRATIRFPAEGEVAGDGPCNAFRGRQTIAYPWIEMTGLASTRRACPDLALEAGYFDMLDRATLAEVSGDVLLLSDDGGLLAVFRAE